MSGRREVLVFVRRAAEVLVLLRSPEGGGYWHPVAGGIEQGESEAEAAARELREETGLEAGPLRPIGSFVYDPGVPCACFLVDAPAGWEPVLDHEHVEARWCLRDDARALLRWPEPRALLEVVCGS